VPLQVPAQAPLPVQAVRPARGWAPALSVVHVPSALATSQASQVPVQALSQQVPSAHVVPATHAVVELQACPFLALHAPVASHVPVQRLVGSSKPLSGAQVWSAVQVMQLPEQSVAAQHPPADKSTHWPPQLTLGDGQGAPASPCAVGVSGADGASGRRASPTVRGKSRPET